MARMLDITTMTPAERLDLIEELWDSLAPEDVRLSAAQDAELARRMANFEADRATSMLFADVEAELDKRT
jgi:putative addiction module component (TIGR02574 family)